MNKFILFALAACLAVAVSISFYKHGHHHHHLNLTEAVKESLRQAWNETSPEAQKACENNTTLVEEYKTFRQGLKNSTKEEKDVKISARWESLSPEDKACVFHKMTQRKEKHGDHHEHRHEENKHGEKPKSGKKEGKSQSKHDNKSHENKKNNL